MDEPQASQPETGNDEAEPVRARVPVENRVLLLMDSAEDAALAAAQVEQIGLSARICTGMADFVRVIAEGAGAAVISDEVLSTGMAELFLVFDRQSTWSDLPVIVLVNEEGPSGPMAILRAFERHPKIKTTFLQRPVPAMSLISAVRSGLKARHRQYQVRDLLEQLNEDVRLRDEFLAMLGHELRNPVSSIGYVAELFEMGESLTPERVKWGAGVINRQVRHLSRLLDQLLDVARVQSGKIELDAVPLDLRLLAEQCLESFEETAKHRHLALSLSERPVMVCGDRVRLTQIVENLLDNAFKYTEDGGNIRLSVQANSHAALTVADDGRGIEQAAVEHVFEPFFQEGGSRAQGPAGLGLGLAMVDNLVRLHGGTVVVRSEGAGRGAEFEMRLPLLESEARAVRAGADAAPLPVAPLRLLIIEDNADLAESFYILLRELGHEPYVICEGQAGIEKVVRLLPDLVFIDIGLPDIDGREVARRIREKLGAKAPPLVALTGYPQRDETDRTFDEYLLKPIGRDRVEELFRSLG